MDKVIGLGGRIERTGPVAVSQPLLRLRYATATATLRNGDRSTVACNPALLLHNLHSSQSSPHGCPPHARPLDVP